MQKKIVTLLLHLLEVKFESSTIELYWNGMLEWDNVLQNSTQNLLLN